MTTVQRTMFSAEPDLLEIFPAEACSPRPERRASVGLQSVKDSLMLSVYDLLTASSSLVDGNDSGCKQESDTS